jgi:hypothetical protein
MADVTPADPDRWIREAAWQWVIDHPPSGELYCTSGNLFLHASERAWFEAMDAVYPGWKEQTREPWTPTVRTRAVAARGGAWRCHYCGCRLASNDGESRDGVELPNVDHKQPRALGGGDEFDNLVLSCLSCNSRKGMTPYDEYVARNPVA